jgi:AraC-like DNA-binding protein
MQHPPLVETHHPGRRAVLRRLTSEECPALKLFHLSHVGVGETGKDFCMVRTNLPGAFLIATISGRGWVRMDGRWSVCEPGRMCLSPPHVVQGCHGDPRERWRFVWCRWTTETTPVALDRADTPLLRKFNAQALEAMVTALSEENAGHAHPTVLHHLVEAVHATVLNFAGAFRADERLSRVWQRVQHAPEKDWTVEGLAATAGCSREHFRRLCVEHIGRPPQHQLTWIRLRHAARMLADGDDKLETIAHASGYSSAFALSNAFQRWMGCRPSALRRK